MVWIEAEECTDAKPFRMSEDTLTILVLKCNVQKGKWQVVVWKMI